MAGDRKSSDFSPGDSKSSDSEADSIPIEDQINQHHLAKKMRQFLELFNESLPSWAIGGLCNAYGFLILRADASGERDKYIQRLQFLAQADYGQMQKMFYLYKAYSMKFQRLLAEKTPELTTLIAPYQKDLIPLKKRFLELKHEFDAKKSDGSELEALRRKRASLEEKITEIRTPFFAAIEKQAMIEMGTGKNQEYLQNAREIYFFINATLSMFDPGDYLKLRSHESKEDALTPREYTKFLELIPTDVFLKEKKSIKNAFSFQFNFTETELNHTLKKVVHDGDMVILESPNHVMYLTQDKDHYFLYDPNANGKPRKWTDKEVVAEIRKRFFLNFEEYSDFLPISLDIYEKSNQHVSRPHPKELLTELLKNRGRDTHINKPGCQHTTLLWVATRAGNIDLVRELLEKWQADPNIVDDEGTSPICEAASHGYTDILKLLVEHKADINKTNNQGFSPLSHATFDGHNETVRMLAELKANMENKNEKSSPLSIAILRGYAQMISTLVECKTNINEQNKEGLNSINLAIKARKTTMIKPLLECKADINHQDRDGYTAATMAVQDNNMEGLKSLIEHQADINKAGADGRSPLSEAINDKKITYVNFLLENDADFNLIATNFPRMTVNFLLAIKDINDLSPILKKLIIPHIESLLSKAFTMLNEISDPEERQKIIDETIQQRNGLGLILRQSIDPTLFGKKESSLEKFATHFKSEEKVDNVLKGKLT